MEINIGQGILEFLHARGAVNIPDFGSFKIVDIQTDFAIVNNVIKPPAKRVSFSTDKIKDKGFDKHISEKYKITSQEAKLAIQQFSQLVSNRVLNYGSVAINGLGKIEKSKDGKLEFTPVSSNVDPNYFHLEPITLIPVAGFKKESLIAKKEVATSAIIAPVAATVVSKIQPQDSKITDSFKQEPTKKLSLNDAYQQELKKAKESVAEPIVYEEESSRGIMGWLWPLLGLLIIGCLIYWIGRWGCNQYNLMDKGINTSTHIEESDNSSIHDMAGNNDEDIESVIDNPNYQKYKDILQPINISEGCIIIVGSFRKASNVIRMKDRIIKAGLDPYTEAYGDLTRVGTLFDCVNHDLDDYVNQLRGHFKSKAWYLSPDYEVPYQ